MMNKLYISGMYYFAEKVKPIAEPVGMVEKAVLEDVLAPITPDGCKNYFSDSQYPEYLEEDIDRAWRIDQTDKDKYKGNIKDCDNFAKKTTVMLQHLLPGLPIGEEWGTYSRGGHAISGYFVRRNGIWVYVLREPQTDGLFIESDWKPFKRDL